MKYCGTDLIIHSPLKTQNDAVMRNLFCFVLCDLLLVAIVILTSCTRRGEVASEVREKPDTSFVLPMSGDSVHKINLASKDTVSSKSELNRRSQKDLIRWATLGGM